MIEKLQALTSMPGWRKIKNTRKTIKSLFRASFQKVFKAKDEHQKNQFVKQYLEQARLSGNVNNNTAKGYQQPGCINEAHCST